MRCIIVDDEHLARKLIRAYLGKVATVEIVGEAKNGMEAIQLLQTHEIELMFLDIQMPDLTGIELIRTLAKPPQVIFTTAYPHFAVTGFELNAVDYLVKPFSFERFVQAINKAQAQQAEQAIGKPDLGQSKSDHFFVKSDYKLVKIKYEDVHYIEGMREYVAIHTPAKRFLVYQSMKRLSEILADRNFLRVHKSFIISLDHVTSVYGNVVSIGEKELPIGKRYREAFLKHLDLL